MKAILVGAVESTRLALEVINAARDWEAAAVITLPLRLAKRHSDFVDLRPLAEKAGAEIIDAPNSNAPEILDRVRDIAPDVTFVIGWSQICKPEFIEAAGGNIIGYHPGPLPQLRVRAVIPWTILLEYPITGSTLFWLDEGMDSGDILAQEFIHVASDETATVLYEKHQQALGRILADGLASIASGSPRRIKQDHRYATWTAKRTPADGEIDWRAPAQDVLKLIRATTRPYPGAFTRRKDETLVIWSAEHWPAQDRHAASPGQIILRDGDGFAIQCGDGALWVTDWTLSGADDLLVHAVFGRDV